MNHFKKIGHWAIDYIHMFRGTASMIIHEDPPKHYLGYVVSGKAPVILIPGITGKWSFMKHLGDRISLAGHPVYVVPKLGYNLSKIPFAAKVVKELILQIIPKLGSTVPEFITGAQIRGFIEKHKIKDVVLVAHSKGGLIGKYMLVHYNHDQRIKGMVAIATPFSGSELAKLVPHHAFQELDTDSKIIRDLESHSGANHRIISIIPEFDNHVWAQKGSYLEGAAENIEVDVTGHHKVLFDKKVIKIVLEALEKFSK